MALTSPPDTCPVPDLPHSVPAIAKSGVDIIQNPPIVRIGDVQESVEDKRAIGQFLANLQARCQNIDMTKTFGKVSIFHVPIEYQEKVWQELFYIESPDKTNFTYFNLEWATVFDANSQFALPGAKMRLSDKFDIHFQKSEKSGLYELVVKKTGGVFIKWIYQQGSPEFHEGIVTLFLLWKR